MFLLNVSLVANEKKVYKIARNMQELQGQHLIVAELKSKAEILNSKWAVQQAGINSNDKNCAPEEKNKNLVIEIEE